MSKPTKCIDPEYMYCQGCKYGYVTYPEWVETREDLADCCFESGCMYGLYHNEECKEDE